MEMSFFGLSTCYLQNLKANAREKVQLSLQKDLTIKREGKIFKVFTGSLKHDK